MTVYKVLGITDAKIGYLSASQIVYEDVPFANRFTQSQNPVDITFEGDNDTAKVFSSSELTGEIGYDKLSDTLMANVFGKHLYTMTGTDNTVGSATVTTPGSAYTSVPTVTFTAAATAAGLATGYAVLSGTTVGSIVMTFGGFGYTAAPTISFAGGGGTGAAATANLAALPTGVVKEVFFGDNAEFTPAYVELVITYVAQNDVTGAAVVVREVLYKVQLSPFRPGDLGNKAKQTHSFAWTALKTQFDIDGNFIPGVSPDGNTYSVQFSA